jgi:hypothetical protein
MIGLLMSMVEMLWRAPTNGMPDFACVFSLVKIERTDEWRSYGQHTQVTQFIHQSPQQPTGAHITRVGL